jgi:hypothetical protein
MAERTAELVLALQTLDRDELDFLAAKGPYLFLEYAAGLNVEWFATLAHRLRDAQHVGLCIDVGHVGIRQAREAFWRNHPGLDLASLRVEDVRLPELVSDVQAAVNTALPTTLELIQAICRLGKPVHFHLHDGHPLIPGLSDHKSFLINLPIPFHFVGRYSLFPMYGPSGLAQIIAESTQSGDPSKISFNLEIHEEHGRLSLTDGASLFEHWKDISNAERMNHWLVALVQNSILVTAALKSECE